MSMSPTAGWSGLRASLKRCRLAEYGRTEIAESRRPTVGLSIIDENGAALGVKGKTRSTRTGRRY